MSSSKDNSGPPGPAPSSGPPGPAPSSGPPGPAPSSRPAQDVTRYRNYLKERDGQTADLSELHEEERLRIGTWRFYYQGTPGRKGNAVALDDAGRAVSVSDQSPWYALLSTEGLDAKGAHKRLTWLMGTVAPIDKTYKLRDATAAAKVEAPTLTKNADGSITFTGWVLYPPNMQTPYRLQMIAPRSGTATVTNTVFDKL